jgi:hypothetical protein
MRRFLIVPIISVIAAYAQTNGSTRPEAAGSGKIPEKEGETVLCTLESITWNPETAELSWVVSISGIAQAHPTVQEKYTIHVDKATMDFRGEARRFDPDEARQVAKLMDLISTYTIESTVWWAKGFGAKVDGTEGKQPPAKEPDHKKDEKGVPVRVGLRVAAIPDAPVESSPAPSPRPVK